MVALVAAKLGRGVCWFVTLMAVMGEANFIFWHVVFVALPRMMPMDLMWPHGVDCR